MTATAKQTHRFGQWAGLFMVSAAVVFGLKSTGAIDRTTATLLAIVPVVLLFMVYRSIRRMKETSPSGLSTAAGRYLTGIITTSMAYVFGLGIALWTFRNLDPSVGVTWLLAMLPILPILTMIYVMGRYIVEETDEYLRHRAIMASLVGLGFVLAIGSFWGFLETFELVPHVPGWWAVPIWAVGMGLGQAWQSRAHSKESDLEE